jgi:hypothetical protein
MVECINISMGQYSSILKHFPVSCVLYMVCMNPSRADSRVNCLKTSDVSETHSVSILRESDHFKQLIRLSDREEFIQFCRRESLKTYIQGVSKMAGQTSRVSSSHQNKEKCSYKHTSRNELILILIEILCSNYKLPI